MSLYSLICVACQHHWDTEASHLDVYDVPCPRCARTGATIDRGDMKAGIPQGRQYVGREWRGQEGVCVEMPRIAKEDLPAWRQDVPSIQTNERGNVVFRSDQHQRQVYRELAATKARAGKEQVR